MLDLKGNCITYFATALFPDPLPVDRTDRPLGNDQSPLPEALKT
jgi:hypothetical protein